MRVLLAAFACRPNSGSETGVGWAVARANASLGHDTVMVTQPRHRDAIEAARREDPALADRLRPVYVGLPARIMDSWDAGARLRGLQLYNMAWQAGLARVARRLHRQRPFDVAHHVTLSTDWVPTGLASVPGLPVVWGPLGGSERVPTACRPFLGARGRATEVLRVLGTTPVRAALVGPAARRCRLLVAQNPDEAGALRRYGTPLVVRPNVFLDPAFAGDAPSPPVAAGSARRGRRAVFVGRLLAWKGVHLAIATMSEPQVSDWTLELFGEGPEGRRLERSIGRHGLGDRVRLLGQRPRDEVRRAMADADALFFPSMREAAGWVVAEALAVGCPVVCLDAGGPPLIAGSSGIAVPPGPGLPASLARALTSVAQRERPRVRRVADELPGLLTEWYSSVGAPAGDHPETAST